MDSLLLMYFTGAATDTTMLLSGRLSIRALRRRSYSSEGIPGVSSFGRTIIGDILSVRMWIPEDSQTDEDVDVTERQVGHITKAFGECLVEGPRLVCDVVCLIDVELCFEQKVSEETCQGGEQTLSTVVLLSAVSVRQRNFDHSKSLYTS